ncbi:hypothetical protein PHMEG_00010498 [Phytophthora megakarya]|uniref:Uncharacterized protein n=1 Tax=Phytophthora megakarya TaxID=4795 RepID=A0A225WEJ0_9STRA|nr:hypothetical protein PHMEG_00010498 [Phytophthora megakarya]
MGQSPVEGFYNQTRQWFNPTKHMSMLPEAAEIIYCIYAFVHKPSVDQLSEIHPIIHLICMGIIPSRYPIFAKPMNSPDPNDGGSSSRRIQELLLEAGSVVQTRGSEHYSRAHEA